MAKHKFANTLIYIAGSFILGFLFIVFLILIISGSILIDKKTSNNNQPQIPISLFDESTYSIKYPKSYQLNENRIVATEGIIIDQENTIQLISPPLNENSENLSMIITYLPYSSYIEEEKAGSTTCPALYGKKLDPIRIGNNTFTTSGQIFCGPDEVAFFYILNDNTIYEIKIETAADYEITALPEIKKILKTMKFKES